MPSLPSGHSVRIPGISFRLYRDEGDLPGMLDVLNDAWLAAGIESIETIDGLTTAYRNLTNCDLSRDLLIAQADREIVAYSRVMWRAASEGGRVYFHIGFVPGAWRRRGLGTALFEWNLARMAEIAADHEPEDGDRTETWVTDRQPGGHALATAVGYRPVAYDSDMVRPDLEDLPDAAIPEGFEVRPPRPDEMREVWEADVEAFRDHFGSVEPTEADFNRFLQFQWSDPSLWRIAWDGPRVASQVRSFINEAENERFGRKRGYTEEISTRRPYRRRGLARALLVMSLHAVRERGMTEAALAVHTDNPHGALALYESVGFRRTLLTTVYRGPRPGGVLPAETPS